MTDPELVNTQHLEPSDLAVRDNRCTLHQVEPYDTAKEAPVMRRCTVVGEVPI